MKRYEWFFKGQNIITDTPSISFNVNGDIVAVSSQEELDSLGIGRLLPSRHQIYDDVEFEGLDEVGWGKVVAVRFTKAKVWYDVLDDYTGEVVNDIPSEDIRSFDRSVKKDLEK